MDAYYPMIKDALGMFLFLGFELSILFILISAGVSLLQMYIPDSKIQAILSGSGGRGYVLAALLGSVTPFCSCSTIPMLRGLLKAKAGFGPTLTFLFTSPLLNPIIIGLFVVTFGLKVTVMYVSIALVVSIVAGVILAQMGYERHVIPEGEAPAASCCGTQAHGESAPAAATNIAQASSTSCCAASNPPVSTSCGCSTPLQPLRSVPSCCGDDENEKAIITPASNSIEGASAFSTCCASTAKPSTPACGCGGTSPEPQKPAAGCCDSAPSPSSTSCCSSSHTPIPSPFGLKVRQSLGDAWRQFKQVFPYLLLGVSLGAFIYGFVPSEFIAEYASGDSLFAVPIAAVIGIPLYVRAEALIPLSAVLVSKGMGLGAVMALIIGGGGASLTEVILLKSMFRMPMIVAFLVVILGMAILAGYLFQFVL